jgi:uncharacterized membrane protein
MSIQATRAQLQQNAQPPRAAQPAKPVAGSQPISMLKLFAVIVAANVVSGIVLAVGSAWLVAQQAESLAQKQRETFRSLTFDEISKGM